MNAMEERQRERQRQDEEWLRDMEKHPRCALIPSPDILDTAAYQGKDVTDTLGDYAKVLDWLEKRSLLNTGFYDSGDLENIKGKRKLSKQRFGAMVQLAFSHSFAPILHTGDLHCEELVFWYYAGHGLGKVNIDEVKKLSEVFAIPKLEEVGVNVENYREAANYLPNRTTTAVKGGELCLHHVGFCDLFGVLEGWIAALKGESQNIKADPPHVKHNKHLVLILDCCYSGTFANDLNTLASTQGPWKENGCTVTVQASCSAEEPTFGGYFTPLFLHLNQNPGDLDTFRQEWKQMCDEQKATFSNLPYPSPVVATTRNEEGNHNLTMEIECQNFCMVLFPDAGFFKYCFVKCFEKQNYECQRTLTSGLATAFLQQPSFTVLDYKLKKLSPHAHEFANTPMGLFLVNSSDPNHVVCVHIHFSLNDTTDISRINLVHHLRPGRGLIYKEERPERKISIKIDTPEAVRLVDACRNEVERNETGRWRDHLQWNMTNNELGVKGLFRLRERLNQRSQDMNKYLQETYK